MLALTVPLTVLFIGLVWRACVLMDRDSKAFAKTISKR